MTTVDLRASVETLSQSPAASFLAAFRPALDRRPARLELLDGDGRTASLAKDDTFTVVLSGELVERERLAEKAGVDPEA